MRNATGPLTTKSAVAVNQRDTWYPVEGRAPVSESGVEDTAAMLASVKAASHSTNVVQKIALALAYERVTPSVFGRATATRTSCPIRSVRVTRPIIPNADIRYRRLVRGAPASQSRRALARARASLSTIRSCAEARCAPYRAIGMSR